MSLKFSFLTYKMGRIKSTWQSENANLLEMLAGIELCLGSSVAPGSQ